MEANDNFSSFDLQRLIFDHAVALLASKPTLRPPQAIRLACEVAVLAFDALRLSATLRNSARTYGINETLANLLNNDERADGGATSALTDSTL